MRQWQPVLPATMHEILCPHFNEWIPPWSVRIRMLVRISA